MRTLLLAAALLASLLAVTGAADANSFAIVPDTSAPTIAGWKWSIAIDAAAAVGNPTLYLARGSSYTFDVSTSSLHPFWIKTVQGPGSLNGYSGTGLSANGVIAPTTITFDVPQDAPEMLFYNCGNHSAMTGPIVVVVFRSGFD